MSAPIAIPRARHKHIKGLARLLDLPGLNGRLAAAQSRQILTRQELYIQLVLPPAAAIGKKLMKIASELPVPMKGKARRLPM
jgi:hypothetical protein